MFREIDRILIGRDEIAARVREIGAALAAELESALAAEGLNTDDEGHITLVPIMTGSLVFVADLIRELPIKLSLDLVTVSSYPGQSLSSKGAQLKSEMPRNLGGKHVLLVDDILDSGQTLKMVRDLVLQQNPASVRTVVLLDKKARREVDLHADHVGFEIPDEFVVGYGLDFNGFYRNTPDIAVLKPEFTGLGT